jgi:hypothetical protein
MKGLTAAIGSSAFAESSLKLIVILEGCEVGTPDSGVRPSSGANTS